MSQFGDIRSQVIGEGLCFATPYGQRRMTYADHAASGRAIASIEQYICDTVLPLYANTHTETTRTGAQTTTFREGARRVIREACHCTEDDAVIFTGNGVTGAIHHLFKCMGLARSCVDESPVHGEYEYPPVVVIGSYEHHSLELATRESCAEVEVVRECDAGGVDLDHLRELLEHHKDRWHDSLVAHALVGCFSAASNVTGRLTDVRAVADLIHLYGGVACFDYAAAGPYVEIDAGAVDAVFLSVHKFTGGPGAPGVLIAKRHLFQNRVPAVPGGGTVASVTPTGHRYLTDTEHREEGGTPNIVGSIRAGLAFQLKQSVGSSTILAHEQDFAARFIAALRDEPDVWLLGDLDEPRLGIVSFVVQHTAGLGPDDLPERWKCLHHNFVVALLNDLFGVQARGGNSCAAPYAHRLLRICPADEEAIDACVAEGWHGCKPGWTRVSFGWYDSEATLQYLIECVRFVARHGWRFLPDYAFDPKTGTWTHRGGRVPLLQLGEVGPPTVILPESVRPSYLQTALTFAQAQRPAVAVESTPYEALRWFWLPGEL